MSAPNSQDAPTPHPYSTVPLPDGIVIGGPYQDTIISWPNGNSRRATKVETVAAQTATLEREVAELKTAIETIRAAWAADDGTAATELAIEDAVCAAMDLAALTRATPAKDGR